MAANYFNYFIRMFFIIKVYYCKTLWLFLKKYLVIIYLEFKREEQRDTHATSDLQSRRPSGIHK